jgi:hypothetical protein
MRDNLHLPRWSAGLVERYEHAMGRAGLPDATPLPLPA